MSITGSEELETAPIYTNLSYIYVLTAIGFGCLIGWELLGVFSPAFPILAYVPQKDAFMLRIVACAMLALTFFVASVVSNWVLRNCVVLLSAGSLLSLSTVFSALAGTHLSNTPLAVSVITWALFGMGQGALALFWCIFLSIIPTRRTALSIAFGSCGGTGLYLLVSTSDSLLTFLIGTVLLLAVSLGLLIFLYKQIPKPWLLPPEDYRRSSAFTVPGGLSTAAHGVIYGFVSILMCSIGTNAAVIAAGCGIFGSLLAMLWAYLGSKVDIDTGMVQRISLPIIVIGLLLIPLADTVGRIACGSFIISALAHSTVANWGIVTVENSEFQLHPVHRYARRQMPAWIGFLIGSLTATAFLFSFGLNLIQFDIVMILLVGIVIIAFSIYGANEDKVKQRLNDLLAERILPEQTTLLYPHSFRQRCEQVSERFGLSPRETEVFVMLAKGRNAGYIQEKLVVSSATVKTHIFHIYRKLDINSQQKLMDIVDNER
jgi:DNA-binding CsgD family transcriptional regulator